MNPKSHKIRVLLNSIKCWSLSGHQTDYENDDSGILQEADVGDTYTARGVRFTCNCASSCSFFELCNETVIARWRTIAAELHCECDLNAI
jgi:hypothetical protein